MKICSKCEAELSKEQFSKRTRSKDGLQPYCKSCDKLYCDSRKNEKTAYEKVYRKAHKREKAAHNKVYNKIHQKEVTAYKKDYTQKRRQTDSQFKVAGHLRTRLWIALKEQNSTKTGSAVSNLGCSIEELRFYLESKFYSNSETGEVMSWDNYGLHGWHIDHIKPLNSFDLSDPEQLKQACHYSNLQPLWAKHNLQKKDKWSEE